MSLDGRTFVIYKFRTMEIDAEKDSGATLASRNDSRRTWFGAILRKISLDELPQFFNVLKGDMSIVGPRPERPELITDYKETIPKYMLRHKIKAGITGWAQVNGRNAISWEEKFEFDVWYVDHASFFLDLKILWLTVVKVMKREGISAEGEATISKFSGSASGK